MIVVECIPQSIVDHAVNNRSVVHTISETSLRKRVGSHRHILGTACYDDVRLTGLDQICSKIYCIQSGSAYNVQSHCGSLYRQSCLERALSCNVLSLCCLNDAAHKYLIHILRLDSCTLYGFLNDDCTQLCCGGRGKCAAHLAYRSAASACNNNSVCHIHPFRRSFCARPSDC